MSAALRTLLRDRLSSVLGQVLERVLEELDRTLDDYEADSRRQNQPLNRALQPRVQLRRTELVQVKPKESPESTSAPVSSAGVQVPDCLQLKPEPQDKDQDQDQDQDQDSVSGVWAPGPLQIKQERQDEGHSVSELSAAAPAETEDSDQIQIQILAVTSLNRGEPQDDRSLRSGAGKKQKTEADCNETGSKQDESDSRGRQNDSRGRQNDSRGRQNDSRGRQNDSRGRQNNSERNKTDISDSVQEPRRKNQTPESGWSAAHSPAAATRTNPKPSDPDTGRHRYMCFCGKLFTKDALRRHQMSHREERPLGCSRRWQTFPSCAELDERAATSHGAESETSAVPGHKCAGSRKRRRTEALGLPRSEGTESLRNTRSLRRKGSGVQEKVASGGRRGFQNKTQNVPELPGRPSDDEETLQNKVSQEEQSKAEGPGPRAPSGEGPSGSGLRCSFCGRKFRLRAAFLSHVREHAGPPQYACDVCGRGFTWLPRLYKHRKTHSEEKLFWCSDCGRTFRERRDLRAHLCIQTGQKPYSCPVCGQDFFLRIQLDTHMRLHGSK